MERKFKFYVQNKDQILTLAEIEKLIDDGVIKNDSRVLDSESNRWMNFNDYTLLKSLLPARKKKEETGTSKSNLLINCPSCKNTVSIRAHNCQKCGCKLTGICEVCKSEIPLFKDICPECGDPNPFESHREMAIAKESLTHCQQPNNEKIPTDEDFEQRSQCEKGKTNRFGKIGTIGFIILIISVAITVFSPISCYNKSLSVWLGFGMIGGFCMLCVGLLDFTIKFFSKK